MSMPPDTEKGGFIKPPAANRENRATRHGDIGFQTNCLGHALTGRRGLGIDRRDLGGGGDGPSN